MHLHPCQIVLVAGNFATFRQLFAISFTPSSQNMTKYISSPYCLLLLLPFPPLQNILTGLHLCGYGLLMMFKSDQNSTVILNNNIDMKTFPSEVHDYRHPKKKY